MNNDFPEILERDHPFFNLSIRPWFTAKAKEHVLL